MDLSDKTIAIIGLGYVGLPLAVEFGKLRPVIGFDVRHRRIAELREGLDRTGELGPEELSAATQLRYSSALDDLVSAACSSFRCWRPYRRPRRTNDADPGRGGIKIAHPRSWHHLQGELSGCAQFAAFDDALNYAIELSKNHLRLISRSGTLDGLQYASSRAGAYHFPHGGESSMRHPPLM